MSAKETFDLFCKECLIEDAGAACYGSDVMILYKDWMRYNPGKIVLLKPAFLKLMDEKFEKFEKYGEKQYKGVRPSEDYDPASLRAPAPAPAKNHAPITLCDAVCDLFRDNIRQRMYPMTVEEAERFTRDLTMWLKSH